MTAARTDPITMQRQRGIAAVMALLVVALVASLATGLIWQQSLMLRQMQNLSARAQIREIARAGAAWTTAILASDSAQIDALNEPWALTLPPVEVERATLSGGLADESGRFNLNNLVQSGSAIEPQIAAFRLVLAHVGLPANLADALTDWMDADAVVRPGGGAEDSYYLALDPPYHAANRPLSTLGELRLVRGFGARELTLLAPLVSVLPATTSINVNTMPGDLLSALVPEAPSQSVLAGRQTSPFQNAQAFLQLLPEESRNRLAGLVAVNSAYFSAHAVVTQDRARIAYRAILQRNSTQGNWPNVLSFHEEPL